MAIPGLGLNRNIPEAKVLCLSGYTYLNFMAGLSTVSIIQTGRRKGVVLTCSHLWKTTDHVAFHGEKWEERKEIWLFNHDWLLVLLAVTLSQKTHVYRPSENRGVFQQYANRRTKFNFKSQNDSSFFKTEICISKC